eukprot:165135_1
MPNCQDFDNPANYGNCDVIDTLSTVGWQFAYYGSNYDSSQDLTQLTYAISSRYRSENFTMENIAEIRWQLPCDCLLDNCMLSSLLSSYPIPFYIDDGIIGWNFTIAPARTHLFQLFIHGKYDLTDTNLVGTRFWLYGSEKSCAQGNITLPQICTCWSPWIMQENTCTDLTCGIGKTIKQRTCDQSCPYAAPEYYGECDKYNYNLTNFGSWNYGCFGGDLAIDFCDYGCCSCDIWGDFSEWSNCTLDTTHNIYEKSRTRYCVSPEIAVFFLCPGEYEQFDHQYCGPSNAPTGLPIFIPTIPPTRVPSNPTYDPTTDPTFDPTIDPTIDPTVDPTQAPTAYIVYCNDQITYKQLEDAEWAYNIIITETSIVTFDTCDTLKLFDMFIRDEQNINKSYSCFKCGSMCVER